MGEPIIDSLIALSGLDQVVVVHRAFVHFTGSLEAGMMLGQLLYWTPRARIPGGWIAKSDAEWSDELCISAYAARKARQRLAEMEIVETKLAQFSGAPTMHYRIDQEMLTAAWSAWLEQSDFAKSQKRFCESAGSDSAKSQKPLGENAESITETTTETTTENTAKPVVSSSPRTILCEIHNVPMKLRQNGSASWYSHKLSDGTWCQGKTGKKRARRSRTDYRAYADQFPNPPVPNPPDPVMPPSVLPETADQLLWMQIQTELQLGMTQATYDTWLRASTAQRTDGTLTITVANEYAQDWLEHRLRTTIERVVKRVAGEELQVVFAVAQQQPESESA